MLLNYSSVTNTHLLEFDLNPKTLELCDKAFQSQIAVDVKKAVKSLKEDPQFEKWPLKRVHLLRTFTLEPYLPFFEFSAFLRGFKVEFKLGDLNGIESELMNSSEVFDATLVFWRAQDLLPKLFEEFHLLSLDEKLEHIQGFSQRIEKLAHWMQINAKEVTFFSLFYLSEQTTPQIMDLHHSNSLKSWIYRWNLELMELSQRYNNWKLCDMQQWLQTEGSAALDFRMDLYGKIPFAIPKAGSLANFWMKHLSLLWKPRIKVIAVDLDQTLWGGILGEDGLSHLKIGQEYPGNVYWKIQQKLKQLRATGILLVLLSKNNLDEVEQAFKQLKEMPLKWSDFVATSINFEPKWSNLMEISKSLSLGLDSFAFLDDQPFEREQMRQFIPEITLLNCHDAPEHILECLNFENLDSLDLQTEDVKRHEEYRLIQERNKLKGSHRDMEGFLKSLELEIEIFPMQQKHLPRAAQMLAKTNQFNLTTIRHAESDLQKFLNDSDYWVYLAKVKDRFSDQGITGLVILKREKHEMQIDSFLLSCRVLGRKVEDALWNSILQLAEQHSLEKLCSQYIKTEKNSQVQEFYDRMGMSCVTSKADSREYESNLKILKQSDLEGLIIHYPLFN